MCSIGSNFPLREQCINLLEHLDINDPKYVNFDAACFMMLTKDLVTLFTIMIRLTNQKVSMKNLPKFDY
jgi:hypothetical protein